LLISHSLQPGLALMIGLMMIQASPDEVMTDAAALLGNDR